VSGWIRVFRSTETAGISSGPIDIESRTDKASSGLVSGVRISRWS
jgi:hypothetical protein